MKVEPKLISLPKIMDERGNLSFIESMNQIPFFIRRVYWIYDVPGGETRGGHAFRSQHEFIVALSGSFDIVLDNGKSKIRYSLNRSYFGLYVPSGYWRSMENFSTNSLALVLASTLFDEKDYIRDYSEYISKTSDSSFWIYEIANQNLPRLKPLQESQSSSVDDCSMIELNKNHRERGNITVIENNAIAPFHTLRVYYLYDVPGGEQRGGHAHKELNQFIVAAGGSFEVMLDDGYNKKVVHLNRPYQGLHIVPGIWRELVNFSSGSTCLVLASQYFCESDYIRKLNDFYRYKRFES